MVSGNKKRNVKYGHLQIQKEVIPQFKERIKPGQTFTETLKRMIKQDIENEKQNRECPEMDPGIIAS